jgi:hypothetical protein
MQHVLSGSGDPRLRPSPAKWPVLEYGCHVRDVLRLYEQRLALMFTQDGPQLPNWDQDATAVEDRYGEQDPVVVAGELATAAEVIAAHLDDMPPANGSAPAVAARERTSPSSPSGSTSSTTRSITYTTSPGPGEPPGTVPPGRSTVAGIANPAGLDYCALCRPICGALTDGPGAVAGGHRDRFVLRVVPWLRDWKLAPGRRTCGTSRHPRWLAHAL